MSWESIITRDIWLRFERVDGVETWVKASSIVEVRGISDGVSRLVRGSRSLDVKGTPSEIVTRLCEVQS